MKKKKKIKNSQPQTKFTGSYKKKSVVCFYSTQSDILLCGIARFSRGNKNISASKMKKIKNSQPQTKFTGSYKKKECNSFMTEAVMI